MDLEEEPCVFIPYFEASPKTTLEIWSALRERAGDEGEGEEGGLYIDLLVVWKDDWSDPSVKWERLGLGEAETEEEEGVDSTRAVNAVWEVDFIIAGDSPDVNWKLDLQERYYYYLTTNRIRQ